MTSLPASGKCEYHLIHSTHRPSLYSGYLNSISASAHRYLEYGLPLVACGLSLAILLAQATYHRIYTKSWNAGGDYQPISQQEGPERFSCETNGYLQDDTDSDDEGRMHQYGRDTEDENQYPHASFTALKSSCYIEESHPPNKWAFNAIELIRVLSQTSISIFATVTIAEALKPACVQLIFWSYAIALVTSRLILPRMASNDGNLYPRFWNHSVFLYAIQWVVGALICRSVYINSSNNSLRITTFISFALSTWLLLLVLSIRKGARTVFIRHEEGLTPCKDQTASLLSLASFSWIESMIWTGFKRPLQMRDVWSLPPTYLASRIISDYNPFLRANSLLLSLLSYLDRSLLVQ